MNKLWMVLLLFCSVSSFATENADFTLKWKEKPKKEDFRLKWKEKPKKEDFALKWQEKPEREDLPKKNNDLQGYRQESRQQPVQMLGYVGKANRMRFSDPQFSTYNSDGGSSARVRIAIKPE